MKKIFILFILMLGVISLPLKVSADTTYNTLNFRGALADEELDEVFSDYKETDDQITIYLFRGKGCGYCRAFLTFMNGITSEYGKYFKMVSYEVWYDEANASLLDEVSAYLDNPAYGVPYIIIGDKVFAGYNSDYDDSIKDEIVKLYKTNKKDRYDVFEEMKKNPSKNANSSSSTDVTSQSVIIWCLVFTFVATTINLIYTSTKFNEIKQDMEKIIELQTGKKNNKNDVREK